MVANCSAKFRTDLGDCAASLENSDDVPALATFIENVDIGAELK